MHWNEMCSTTYKQVRKYKPNYYLCPLFHAMMLRRQTLTKYQLWVINVHGYIKKLFKQMKTFFI